MGDIECCYMIFDGIYTKIGKSNRPKERLKDLQVGNPEELILLFYSPFITEEWTKKKFEEYNVRGEWYNIPEHELFDFVKNINKLNHFGYKQAVCLASFKNIYDNINDKKLIDNLNVLNSLIYNKFEEKLKPIKKEIGLDDEG